MRLIDADKVNFEEVFLGSNDFSRDMRQMASELIDQQPTVEAEPVKHGKWIFHLFDEIINGDWIITNDWIGNGYECSECGKIYEQSKKPYTFRFCPTCGAKMDGERKGCTP